MAGELQQISTMPFGNLTVAYKAKNPEFILDSITGKNAPLFNNMNVQPEMALIG